VSSIDPVPPPKAIAQNGVHVWLHEEDDTCLIFYIFSHVFFVIWSEISRSPFNLSTGGRGLPGSLGSKRCMVMG